VNLTSNGIIDAVRCFRHAVVDGDDVGFLFHILIFLSVWLLSGDRTATLAALSGSSISDQQRDLLC
jgi:hypothetical protein